MFKAQASALAVAALALAACGQPAPTNAPQPATTTETPTAASTEAVGVTPAMLIGRWGDNGDCSKDIVFRADGAFSSYTGGSGTWSLNGDRMTMTGANGTFEVGVEVIDGTTLLVRNGDGSIGTSQRCDAAGK